MNFPLHLSLWGVILAGLVGLYLYQHWLENHDDHYIHLHGDSHDEGIINQQNVMGRRLEVVERVKYGALAAVVVYGLAIAAMGTYWALHRSAF